MPQDPSASQASSANDDATSSKVSREKPRPARRRRSAGVTLSFVERPPQPLELGLEGGDGACRHLRGDQAPPEVGSDRRVPVTSAREQLGAALCQAGVVDRTGAGK